VHPRPGERSAYTLELVAAPGAHPTHAAPRIAHIVADGVLQRAERLVRSDGWSVVAPQTPGTPSSLECRSCADGSRVQFEAESFLLLVETHRWPGVLRVLEGNRELHRLDLAGHDWVSVEAPIAVPSNALFALALITFGAAAVWLGPFRRRQSCLPWLVFSLTTLHVIVWASHPVAVEPDSPVYLENFEAFLDGRPGYFPPGYPLLVGLMTRSFGHTAGTWLALVQHAMVVVASVWIFAMLRRLAPEEIALAGAVTAGSLASVVVTAQWVMSEVATLFTMTGAMYFATRSAQHGRRAPAVVCGLLTGWAVTMRVVPLVALLPGILLLHLAMPVRRWRSAALIVGVAAGLTCIPVIWFLVRSGESSLANSSGLHLFNRVMREQHEIARDAPATRELQERLGGADPRGLTWWDAMTYPGVSELSDHDVERLFWHASLETIARYPIAFAGQSARLAWRELSTELSSTEALVWGATEESLPPLENGPPLRFTAAALQWRDGAQRASRAVWPTLCWLAIAGSIASLVWRREPILVLALLWVSLSYLVVSASLDEFSARHNVELTPFVAALAMVPLGMLLGRPQNTSMAG
jgi:hypothetical protein